MHAFTNPDVTENSHNKSIVNAVLRLACMVKTGFRVDIDLMKLIYVLCKSRI